MLTINIISVGHKIPTWINTGCEYYKKLLCYNININFINLPAVSSKHSLASNKETKLILAKIKDSNTVIALDEDGKQHDSKAFASFIKNLLEQGNDLDIIVGPTDGLSKEIITKSQYTISLSKLTFTHDMVKVILLEQLFRATSIINGRPYHRD